MGRGSKKNRQQDFQKVKLKVGKKLKKADNVTNTSFKTRSIQISQQLKSKDGSQPSTRKKQNIAELLTQCSHYSASVRNEAVTGLRELVTSFPEVLMSHPANILERAGELLSDKDSVVRQGSIKLFKVVLAKLTEKRISPFFPLLCAHLCCAMTHINDEIQVDSLTVLDLLLDAYPAQMIRRSSQVLSNFVEQISRQSHGQAKRMLTSNPDSKTSSQKWRGSVLKRLQAFLSAILSFHDDKSESFDSDQVDYSGHCWEPNKPVFAQNFPSFVKSQWEVTGFLMSSSALDSSVSVSEETFGGKIREFTNTLVPLLLECWLECSPAQSQSTDAGGLLRPESASMMSSVLEVTRLIWECSDVLNAKMQETRPLGQTYMKDFQHHFLSNFPYSVQEASKGNAGGKKEKFEKVSAETLNLSICDIMTHFLSRGEGATGTPDWVPDILQYLREFLSGSYGTDSVGHSCKSVVRVLDRMLASGLSGDEVDGLVSAVLARYQRASPLSQEKRGYLQFLARHTPGMLGEELEKAFLHTLPELLPLVARDQPKVAALVLETMKKAACRRCRHFLETAAASTTRDTQWFDSEQGAILHLTPSGQKQLIGLLYHVPEIGAELLRTFTRLVYSEQLQGDAVTYLIQLLQNRYLSNNNSHDESVLHISFLASLVLGMSKDDIDAVVSKDDSQSQALALPGGYCVLDTYTEESTTGHWDRHSLIVQAVSSVVTQFNNTDQVVQIMLEFFNRFICSLSAVPLQVVFGICLFVNTVTTVPESKNDIYTMLAISLVNHTVITWEQPTNQELRKSLQVLACNLVTKLPGGLAQLLQTVLHAITDTNGRHQLNHLLQTVLLFLTDEHQDSIRSNVSTSSMLVKVLEAAKQSYSPSQQPSLETEKLVTSMEYLMSQLIQ